MEYHFRRVALRWVGVTTLPLQESVPLRRRWEGVTAIAPWCAFVAIASRNGSFADTLCCCYWFMWTCRR